MKILSLLFLAFFPIFGHLVLGGRNASQQLNFDAQNEEAITMETPEGDIVDCVNIYKQISLTHPSLSNHVVQMNPSWMAEGDSNANAAQHGHFKACPKNMVPVPRSTIDLGRKFAATDKREKHMVPVPRPTGDLGRKSNPPDQHRVLVLYEGNTLKYGAGAGLNVYDLNTPRGQFSSHNIWVQGNDDGHLSMIVAGWRADVGLYGDSKSRMFIYWTGDNYLDGCYDTLCAGFIQVDRVFHPGMVMYPTSTYGGEQFIFRHDILQDRETGHWWLMLNRKRALGYWPRQLLPNLKGGATVLAWGGLAKAGGDGICPPLGNGHFPDASHKAMYLRSLEYTDSKNHVLSTGEVKLESVIDKSGCYGLQLDPNNTVVYIGGPGGCHCGA